MKEYLRQKFIQDKVSWKDFVAALMLAIFAAFVVFGLEKLTVEKFSNISSILILSVLVSAMLFGKGPAILTAVVCSFLYDWLMVPPFFMPGNNIDNAIKFSVFVVAALLTSWIASMARNSAIALVRRERELITLIEERERYKREKEQESLKREAETLRNAILASVSHDLKTPLVSIIGAVSSFKISWENFSDDDRTHLITSVLGEANKLHGYINNILEVARLEDMSALVKREELAVDDVIDLPLKRLSSVLRSHVIEVKQEDESLAFMGDERLMDIALGNVLDNAVKFSEQGTVITLTTRPLWDERLMMMEILDEGEGVTPEEADKVLDKFYRVSKADQKNTGTGLGLWIARRIIEAHGGTIQLQPGQEGRGTCVRILLPLVNSTVPDAMGKLKKDEI